MASIGIVKELENCATSSSAIAAAMFRISGDLKKMQSVDVDKLICDKKYPKVVLLSNLLYEIEDKVTNIINDTVEKIVKGVDDES